MPDSPSDIRPILGADDHPEATQAVADLVAELQAGWNDHNADVTDRRLAADVLWGSPYGATVYGYQQLHAIHVRLKQQGTGGPSSRYEIVQIRVPTPDVAIAHVRRAALDLDGQPLEPTADTTGAFSEMALYVLVRRDNTWWLAAGHNTPIRPAPPSSSTR